MATTMGVTLAWGENATLGNTLDIVDFPDLGGGPERVDITTLSDTAQVGLKGVEAIGALPFTANYTKDEYDRVKLDANKPLYYGLKIDDTKTFTWQGSHIVYVTGGGVNDPVRMRVVIAPTSRPI